MGTSQTDQRDGVDVTDPVLSDGAAGYTPGTSERRSSATKYLHEDFLGSTTRLTDASQATTDTRQYDAFGNVVSTSGSNPLPFAFAGGWGYQTDSDSGLQLLGHRYYDPSTGRFLTRDPARDGRNWYEYCKNNPTRAVDLQGFRVYYFGIGGQCVSILSGSVLIGIFYDPDSGQIGLGSTVGIGIGPAIGASLDAPGLGYDPTTSIDGRGIVSSTGSAGGLMTPVGTAELALTDGADQATGGWGGGVGPGVGGGPYLEKRWTTILPIRIGPHDPWDGSMWNGWPGEIPKPNDRVPNSPWYNPKYE